MIYNKKFLFGLLVLGLLFSACTQTPEQRAKAATVLIVLGNADGTIRNGSGFFVTPDKIATNIHVVAGAKIVFAVSRKKVYNIEKVTGYDPERDLVVLQVSGKGKPLELGEGKIDEPIFAVGYPGGGYDHTAGTVHGIRESDKRLSLVVMGFQKNRDSVLAPGNSGGPVLNSKGQFIGIAAGGGKDFGVAIASSALNTLLNSSNEENLSDWQKRTPMRAHVYEGWATKKLIGENYNEAIKGFDKALALYKYADAYNKLGSAKDDLGRYQEAIQDYDKGIELIPDDVTLHNNRGNSKRKSGDYIGAIQDYDKVLELNPDYSTAYFNRGAAKAEMLDYIGAIEDYSKTIDNLNPRQPWKYYLNRGDAKRKSEDYDGAIEDYTEAIKLKDDLVDAYLNRGVAKADRLVPDYAGAIEDYNKVIALNSDDGRAYNNRGNAKKALGQDADAKRDHAAAYYYWGKVDSNSGDYQAAIEKFDEAVALVPNYVEVYHYRGNAYRLRGKKGDYQAAIKDYDKVVALKPDYSEIHIIYNNQGLAKAAIDNYDEAISDYTEAIRLKLDYAEGYYNRGDVYQLRGKKDFGKAVENFQKAVKDYDKVVRLKDDFTDAYRKRGLAKEALGQTDAAKLDFAMAYYLEAQETKQYQEAIKNFNIVLELIPNFARAYHARDDAKIKLGKSKADLGDLEGARNLYQEVVEDRNEAIKLDPETSPRYYGNRGRTKLLRAAIRDHNDHNGMIEDYESAIEDFTKAIKRQSGFTADFYNLRGLARCMLGYVKANQGKAKAVGKQYNLALEDFKEAIKLEGDNASYHKGLGLANAALGKAKATIDAFEKTKQLEEAKAGN